VSETAVVCVQCSRRAAIKRLPGAAVFSCYIIFAAFFSQHLAGRRPARFSSHAGTGSGGCGRWSGTYNGRGRWKSFPGARLRTSEPAAPADGHGGADPRAGQLPDTADQAERPGAGREEQVEGGRHRST